MAHVGCRRDELVTFERPTPLGLRRGRKNAPTHTPAAHL
jgi:hypothetical protein